jgi:hypothetical protein
VLFLPDLVEVRAADRDREQSGVRLASGPGLAHRGADRMRDAEAREQNSMTGARCWNNSALRVLWASLRGATHGRSGTRGDASSDS